jgi:hypothetical protein
MNFQDSWKKEIIKPSEWQAAFQWHYIMALVIMQHQGKHFSFLNTGGAWSQLSNRRWVFFRKNENIFMVSRLILVCVVPWPVFIHVMKYEMVLFIKKINVVVIYKFSFLWEFGNKWESQSLLVGHCSMVCLPLSPGLSVVTDHLLPMVWC